MRIINPHNSQTIKMNPQQITYRDLRKKKKQNSLRIAKAKESTDPDQESVPLRERERSLRETLNARRQESVG